MTSWKKRMLCALLALSLCLGGCSDLSVASVPTAEGQSIRATAAPRDYKKDVTISMVIQEDTERHPASTRSRDLLSLYALVYEGLFYLGEEQTPQSELLERWSTQDNQVWSCTLRANVRFHDGTALTATDVQASVEYLQGLEGGTSFSGASHIASVEVVSDLEFRITALTPGYAFLWSLCFPIFPSHAIGQEGFPAGTGPYKIDSFPSGGELRLVRNESWWKRAAGIDSITAIPFSETELAISALKNGEIDMCATNRIHITQFRSQADMETLDYQTNQLEYLIPNLGDSLLRDVRMRKAIIHAIDRQKLIENAYMGLALSSDVPFVPGTCMYSAKSAVYDYDPALARGYLEELGYRDYDGDSLIQNSAGNLELTIIVSNQGEDTCRQDALGRIVRDLRAIGIDAKTEKISQSKLLQRLEEGDYDLALVGAYLNDYPDISELIATGGALNMNGYSSGEIDAMLDTVLHAADSISFFAALNRLQSRFVQELPVICLYFRVGMLVSRETLGSMRDIRETDVLLGFESILRAEEEYVPAGEVVTIPFEAIAPTTTPPAEQTNAPTAPPPDEEGGDGRDTVFEDEEPIREEDEAEDEEEDRGGRDTVFEEEEESIR